MKRFRDIAAVIAMGMSLIVVPVFAMEPLSDSELDDIRGGFVSAGGFEFDFGVELQTFVDGTLALASTLSLNENGITKVTASNVPDAVPLAEAAALLPDLKDIKGDGLVLDGNGGVTVLVQDLSQTSIRNLVVNTAQDRTIVQNTTVNIVMSNLDQLQQAMFLQHLSSSLDQALNAGLLDSTH